MAAGTYNFTIEQGATLDEVIFWKNGATPPAAVNLTGFTARMQVRPNITSSTVLAEFTTSNGGITIPNPTLGEIHIKASATITEAYNWPLNGGVAQGVYDLEMISSTGVVTRLLAGTITLSPEVTR